MMVIYKITNKINGMSYIGKTCRDVNERWKRHCKLHKYTTYIQNAIQKHGKENFTFEVIDGANSESELNYREKHHIYIQNTIAPNGYNLRGGGDGGTIPKEVRTKIGLANKGKKRSLELKQHFSETRKGRKLSPESIAKAVLANTGKKRTFEQKKALSEIQRNHSNPIVCNETGQIFNSVAQASEKMAIHHASITQNLAGITVQTKGSSFRYLDDRLNEKARRFRAQKEYNKQHNKTSSKPILCPETGKTYPSIRKAAQDLNMGIKSIQSVLNGQWNQCKGLSFKYIPKGFPNV